METVPTICAVAVGPMPPETDYPEGEYYHELRIEGGFYILYSYPFDEEGHEQWRYRRFKIPVRFSDLAQSFWWLCTLTKVSIHQLEGRV